jgi:hypothetical protein
VLDGGPHRDTEKDVVCIGFTGTPGVAAVEDTRSREGLATKPDREQYDVTCLASSWRGEERDAKVVRDAAYALVDAIAEDLAKDQRLGGLVLRANLTTSMFAQEQTSKGAVATLRFIVHIDAFTGR